MNQSLEKKLIEALEALERGRAIDQILARYPEDREQLRPMLEIAVQLSELNLQPSLAAQTRSRRDFLNRAETMRKTQAPPSPVIRLRQLLLPLLSLALVLLVFGGALLVSAGSAVPGDLLYSVKRFGENVRLAFTTETGRALLAEQYRQERIEEILVLLATGREAQVAFEGIIESIEEDTWVVAGLVTGVDEDTVINGVPEVGSWVHVVGQTQDGQLHALVITISPGDEEPLPLPTAAPTATVTPESTTMPTNTPPPTITREATATPTVQPSSTATNIVTATVSPTSSPTTEATVIEQATPTVPLSPTATPIPDDNDNDNGNDNDGDDDENDNGNNNDNGNDNNGGDDNDNGDNDNDNGGDDNSNDNDDDDGDD